MRRGPPVSSFHSSRSHAWLLIYSTTVRCHTQHVFHEQSWALSDFFWGDGHFSSVQSMGAIVRSCHPVLIWALMYLINKGALFSLTVVTPWFLRGRLVAQGYAVNNPLAAIKGALTMIIMIKGIHLITGLLNYSSVEARLFGRMLIIPPHSWQVLFQSTSLFLSRSRFLSESRTLWLIFMQIDIRRMFCLSLSPFSFDVCEWGFVFGVEHLPDKTGSGIIKSN